MKTKLALAFFYLAIGFLVACAVVIVVKLIFWPACTQVGNTCVVDGWSSAGLASTVLGVSATVLAILGAVAVAGWWTSLNDRVTNQVKKLYDAQKVEVSTRVDTLLSDQRNKVKAQMTGIDVAFEGLKTRLSQVSSEIDVLNRLAYDIEEIAVDGLMVIGASNLEEWAQKATKNQRFPRVPLKMAESYLDEVENMLSKVENNIKNHDKELKDFEKEYDTVASLLDKTSSDTIDFFNLYVLLKKIEGSLEYWLSHDLSESGEVFDTLANWEGVLRWQVVVMNTQHVDIGLAVNEKKDAQYIESQKLLEEKIHLYNPRLEQLKQGSVPLSAQSQALLALVTPLVKSCEHRLKL